MYLTVEEYIQRAYLGETERLASEDGVLDGGMDTTENPVVETCIRDASEQVDSYLRGRYELPLDTVPELIKRLAFQIARFYLYEKKNILSDVQLALYDRALKELVRLRKGEVMLESAEVSGEQSLGQVVYLPGTQKFSPDSLGGYYG